MSKAREVGMPPVGVLVSPTTTYALSRSLKRVSGSICGGFVRQGFGLGSRAWRTAEIRLSQTHTEPSKQPQSLLEGSQDSVNRLKTPEPQAPNHEFEV